MSCPLFQELWGNFEQSREKRKTALSQTMRTEPFFCHFSMEIKSPLRAEFEKTKKPAEISWHNTNGPYRMGYGL
jgi:uncharacterized membrane protein YkgB